LIVPYLPKLIRTLTVLLLLNLAACGGGAPATTAPENITSPTTAPDVTEPTASSPSETDVVPPTLTAETEAPPVLPTAAPTGVPVSGSGVQLVARVNGDEITLAEFEQALNRRQVELNAADPAALRDDVLNQLIEQKVIEQGAAAQQITVSDEEVQTELQSNIEIAGSEDAWTEWLAINQYTPEEFATTLRDTLITNRVRDNLTADLNGDVQQVHARHILLRTEDEAKAALTRLTNGEDFATLAGELSNDETTRNQGGDLGWFTQEELLVPELAQTAFALQPGQIGGPVGTELGYHVIQTLEFADRPIDPERRVFIAQARFENWLRPLLENAAIERYI
jgi:peptidyl-prolyl cis-trans isomerase C